MKKSTIESGVNAEDKRGIRYSTTPLDDTGSGNAGVEKAAAT